MKHAAHKAMAHKAAKVSSSKSRMSRSLSSLRFASHASHGARMAAVAQTDSGEQAQVVLDAALAARINAVAPRSRRSIRESARAAQRRSVLLTSSSLAALVGTAATAMAFTNPLQSSPAIADPATTTMELKRIDAQGVSRSEERTNLEGVVSSDAPSAQTTNEGAWQLSDANTSFNVEGMTKATANNAQVATWLDGDRQYLPNGFDPNHATGDAGNAYEFSQCTWWVYVRRHQLGLPVGSHMGNGNMWGNSARALGYWVDHSARHVGDVMVFAAGQDGADPVYGHVAVIEKINSDGSVQTSESGAIMNGATYSRTYTVAQVAQHDIIHY